MKRILKVNRRYLMIFLFIVLLSSLSGCNGVNPTLPIINSFTANPSNIDSGDSSVLSWNVTNATTITILPGNMTFTSPTGSVAVFPTVTTNYTLTATNAEGNVSSSVAVIVTSVEPEEKTLTIQPGPVEGKDSYVSSLAVSSNYGSEFSLMIGKHTVATIGLIRANYMYEEDDFQRSFLQFDLSELPEDAVIVGADLKLHVYAYFGTADIAVGVYQVTESWEESSITWNNRPNYLLSPESTILFTLNDNIWLSWNITSLVQGWLDGSIVNYGVTVKNTDVTVADTTFHCFSSDELTFPTLRPKLEITYYVP
jgi:hypothetical protein